jgi:hypothetical protein
MLGKKLWRLGFLGMVLMGSGCCKWCHRWCDHHPSPTTYAAPQSACVPCAPVCPPGCCPVGSAAAAPHAGTQWQRNYAVTPPPCCP